MVLNSSKEKTIGFGLCLPKNAVMIPGLLDYCAHPDGSIYTRNVYGSKTGRKGPWWKMTPRGMRQGDRQTVDLYFARKEHTTWFVSHVILTTFVGPRPKGMEACHNNGNHSDNRVENLRWDTHENNLHDMAKHGTLQYGELHPAAKVSNAMADKIRDRIAKGEKQCEVAKDLGLTKTNVNDIVHYRTYRKGPLAKKG